MDLNLRAWNSRVLERCYTLTDEEGRLLFAGPSFRLKLKRDVDGSNGLSVVVLLPM